MNPVHLRLLLAVATILLVIHPAIAAAQEPEHRRGLIIAGDEPPPPPREPPPPPIEPSRPWAIGNRSLLWAPTFALGPTLIVTRDFAAPGFDIGVGVRHYRNYNPNPLSHSTPAAVASLGVLALPKGALLGNLHGVDLTSRVYFLPGKRIYNETALRPVARVLVADSRVSLPSLIGTLVPAIGFATVSSNPRPPRPAFNGDYAAFLSRWAFGVHVALVQQPLLIFVDIEPTVSLLVPYNGDAPHAAFGTNFTIGVNILEN